MAKSEQKQTSFDTLRSENETPREIPEEQVLPVEEGLKYEKNNQILTTWLDKNFKNKTTMASYCTAIRHFLRIVYPHEIGMTPSGSIGTIHLTKSEIMERKKFRRNELEYFIDKYIEEPDRVFVDDFKQCIHQFKDEEYAPKTINTFMSEIKKFFDRQNPKKYRIEKSDMDDIRASLMPPSISVTRDEIPIKEELKSILNYLTVKNKAIFLFLICTGCRIGAVLALRVVDLNLDATPPHAEIVKTKKMLSGRRVWITPETKEALLAWLNIKDTYLKKTGAYYDKKLVFDSSYESTQKSWCLALKKAGLDQRDPNTKARVRKYHIHTLRKFFSTEMADAGMVEQNIHALMGHRGYLADAYKRPRRLAERYAKYMGAVTIFEKDVETEMREEYEKVKAEKDAMFQKDVETYTRLMMIAKALGIETTGEIAVEDLQYDILYRIEMLQKRIEQLQKVKG